MTLKEMLSARRRYVIGCCGLTIVLGMLISADAFVLQALIDSVEAGDRTRFVRCALTAVMVVAVESLVYWRRQSSAARLSCRLLAGLRSYVFSRLRDVPLPELGRVDVDRLLSQMTVQLGQVRSDLIDVGLYGFMLLSQVTFAVVSMMAMNPVLGVCALVLCVPMALVPVITRSRVERARAGLVTAENGISGTLGDLLRGMADWRLFGRDRQVVSRFEDSNGIWLDAAESDAAVQMGVDSVVNALSHVLIFGIWLVGGVLVMRGNLDVARIVAMYALIGNVSVPLFQMSGLIAQWQAGWKTLSRLRDDVASWRPTKCAPGVVAGSAGNGNGSAIGNDEERTVPYRTDCVNEVGGDRAGLGRIVCHALRLHGAGKPFDLDLPMDGPIVVIGPSGAGKSSLLRVLAGFDDDYQGTVLVDGVPAGRDAIRFDDVSSVRIGYLSQRSHVFRDTIRENVRLFDERMDDDAILRALDAAQLGEWVRERGLDFVVDDSLTVVSGGERQRLLLARVFAQGYEHCLLDEFDTGLDAATAQRIEQVVVHAFRCPVIVTHRASPWLIDHARSIVMMREGTVVNVVAGRSAAS